jgi:hypothetical protein
MLTAISTDDLLALIRRIQQEDLDELTDCLTGPTDNLYLNTRREIVIDSLGRVVDALEAST